MIRQELWRAARQSNVPFDPRVWVHTYALIQHTGCWVLIHAEVYKEPSIGTHL